MSMIKRTNSHVYVDGEKREEEAHSQTIIANKTNLKELIKQTTLKDSQKINMSKSKHPLVMLKKALSVSLRKHDIKCSICETSYDPKQITKLCDCDHQFCRTCIDSYMNYKINAFQPLICPEQKCEGIFSKQSDAFLGLPIEMKNKYEKNLKFIEANKNPNLKQCHQPNCEGYFNIGEEPSVCDVCKVQYCPKCSFKFHLEECQDYHVEFLQNNYKFSSCKNMIQKNQGCNHISCRCGHNFCYLCGADWETDPCRFGGNPPPPPPPPRHPCVQVTVRILKVLFAIIYCPIALPLWLVGCILIIAASMVISAVIGGIMLFIQIVSSTDCCGIVISTIFLPTLLIGGIFWYFLDNIEVTCDFLAGLTQGLVVPISWVCEM